MTAQRPEHAPLGYRASGPSGGVGVEAVLSIIANLATSISSISTRIVTRVTMRLLFMQECEAVHRSELGLQVNHAHRFGPNWKKPMLRYTLSALALAGFLAAAHPVWAGPVSDHAQAEASAAGQEVASPAPASPPGWSSQPASAEHLNDVPVGFGWG